MKWYNRKNVRKCLDRDIIDCPRCGLEYLCNHEDAVDFECNERGCPRFKNGRWKDYKDEN